MVDASVHQAAINALRQDGYDVIRSPDAGKAVSPSDPEVIEAAALDGRILLTTDVNIDEYYLQYIEDGNEHPGLLKAVQWWKAGELVRNVRYTLGTAAFDNLRNNVLWVQRPK